jgi:hypothetical protein
MDAMQLELSNFPPLAPNEEEAPDLGGAEHRLVLTRQQAEGERVQAETVQYIALTGAASASVKIIVDALRAWRTADPSDHKQSHASRNGRSR